MGWGSSRFRGIISLAAGRRAKWVVLALWVVVAGVAGPLGGELTSVEKNDQSSFLPASAESTRVLDLQKRFSSSGKTPAVVVYRREGGLTAADRSRVVSDREAIRTAGLEGVGTPSPPIPSRDGTALLFTVPIVAGGDPSALQNAVAGIRDRVEKDGGGLEVGVTGPAGFTADLTEVFGSLDTRLLLATAAIVAVLLLLIYRSPFPWLVPLVSVGFAEATSQAAYYGLAKAGLTISGQTAGLATVLLFGAGTDYALLLVARYREELRRHEDRHEAMAYALRQAGPAILASAGTVAIGLLCLLAAELNNSRGLGPVGAVAVGLALAAMLTALPALLLVLGRGVFWPYVPRYGSSSHEDSRLFSSLGSFISRRPRAVWAITALVLVAMALGLSRLDTGLTSLDAFRASVDSVKGQKLLEKSYPSGSSVPTTVVVRLAGRVGEARDAVAGAPNVARVGPVERSGNLARFDVTLSSEPYGTRAFHTIKDLRDRVEKATGKGALVGGSTAQELDVRQAAARDTEVIVPLVLVVVLVILGLLLRSVVAPLVLIATVILSFAASLGASVVVFDKVFGFPGIDPGLPLLAFIFLVALGVDYNIFLVARAREEAAKSGTRAGMLKSLVVTGGVITSAGLVLAGTFSVLGVLPLAALTEIGFIVAFGVLLDTAVVRSVLVPALFLDAGSGIWWPCSPDKRAAQEKGP